MDRNKEIFIGLVIFCALLMLLLATLRTTGHLTETSNKIVQYEKGRGTLRSKQQSGHGLKQEALEDQPKKIVKIDESDAISENLPPCPKRSPYIKNGFRKSVQTNASAEFLEKLFFHETNGSFPPVRLGGVYRPKDCKAKQRVAIIVAYRNRYQHVHLQIQNLFPLLMRQQADFTYFVVEQDWISTFNKGILFNAGFIQAKMTDDFDCFLFHDADLLPLNDNCLYLCKEGNPLSLIAGISKFNYKLSDRYYYGGIVAFTKEQFEKVNGFSNLYFGWGAEDEDLLKRVMAKGYKLVRYPTTKGLFDMVKHELDKGNSLNPDRFQLLKASLERQEEDGLNNVVYTKTSVELKPLYTWMKVSINLTQVLKTAPRKTVPYTQTYYKDTRLFDVLAATRPKSLKAIIMNVTGSV